MRKQIDKTKWFKLICWEWERNDLLLWVEGKAKANGKTLLKSLIWEASEEFMTQLGISFKQEKIDEQFIKPKKVADKNDPDIPVTPRDKGAPVKEKLTLKFVNDRVSALEVKVDALEVKVDNGFRELKELIIDQRREFKELVINQGSELKELITNQRSEFKELITNQRSEFKELITNQRSEFKELIASQRSEFKELIISQREY